MVIISGFHPEDVDSISTIRSKEDKSMACKYEQRVVIEEIYMGLHPTEDYTFTSIRTVEFEDDKVVWYDEDPIVFRLTGTQEHMGEMLAQYQEALSKPPIYIRTERKVG